MKNMWRSRLWLLYISNFIWWWN